MEAHQLPSEILVTSFLLSNLHCPSCVSSIEESLFGLQPKPISVSPSVVTSWVTVRHTPTLSIAMIQNALEDSGFDVASITRDGSSQELASHVLSEADGTLEGLINQTPTGWNLRPVAKDAIKHEAIKYRHLQDCVACRAEQIKITRTESTSYASEKSTNSHQETRKEYKQHVNDSIVVIDAPDSTSDLWRVSLAIGGMTCASCSNAITLELGKKDYVRKVAINLIGNSATIEFIGKDNLSLVIEGIEDIGYDATIDSVTDLSQAAQSTTQKREIELKIVGMFCEHCPERVLRSLDVFGDVLYIERPATLQNPILKITYTPRAPDFTIRHVVDSISAVGTSFEVSVYHPPTLEERSHLLHERERHRLLIRLVLTILVAIPTFVVGVVLMSLVPSSNPARQYLTQPWVSGVGRSQWALFILATPVYFLAADVFHRRAIKEVRSLWRRSSKTPIIQRFYRFGSMNMLMSLGTSIAYISSVAQLIVAGVNHPETVSDGSFYFDSVVFLTMFLLIGRIIEAFSKSRTGDAVTKLGMLRPKEAHLIDCNGRTSVVNPDLLESGDIVRIMHGVVPPCDGRVVDGHSEFDESSLTGESRLVKKAIDDEIFAGTINKGAPVSVRVVGAAGSSMLDEIVRAVREGQTKRAPIEKIADTLTGYFVPAVTLLAIITWLIWLSLGFSGSLPKDYLDVASGGWAAWSLQFAIALFVVACPCGLALAAPTALFVGGGLAAQHGILVKGGGEAFEKASRLDCIVFDKTGTLTVGGEPAVTDHGILYSTVETHKVTERMLLSAIQKLEESSSHPIARAIVSFCKTQDKSDDTLSLDVYDIEEISGRGMKGQFSTGEHQVQLILGNESLMTDNEVDITVEMSQKLNIWKSEGKSVALAASNSSASPTFSLFAIFAISDPIRPEAPGLIASLKARKTDVWMLSGDNPTTAHAIGAQVGISPTNIIAGVLPSQKADQIRLLQRTLKARNSKGQELSQRRAIIAMVGDGINDSPALTAADVGIAIGSGSDIAISSAEFVLITSELTSLLTLLDLSRLVFQRIKFNFGWALVYNLLALPVAAGVLYPVVSNGSHIRLDPVWASLAMAASSISVVCSSLALRSGLPVLGFRVDKASTVRT